MMIKNFEKEFNLLEEWDKIAQHPDVSFKATELARLSLICKAGLSLQFCGKPVETPQGVIRLEWDHFLRTCIEDEKFSILYEYCFFAARKNQVIPLNLLIDFIQLADKNHELAEFILPVLGDCGENILLQNSNWNYLITEDIDFTRKKFSDSKIYIVKKKLQRNPLKGIQFIIDTLNQWTDKELNSIISILVKVKLEKDIIESLNNLYKKICSQKNINFFPLMFILDEAIFSDENKKFIREQISTSNWGGLFSKTWYKNHNKANIKFVVSNLPVGWIQEIHFIKYLNFIQENNLFEELIESLIMYHDSQSAEKVCKYLLNNKIFTETFSVEKISPLLDHKQFNEIAIRVLREGLENTDLEAFLFLIKYFKHFWSDDLVFELIKIFKIKKLEESYNFDIFYDFFPFRMNPNASIEREVPVVIKDSLKHPFSYSTILHFRKIIRK